MLDQVFKYGTLEIENVTYGIPLGESVHVVLEMEYILNVNMAKDQDLANGESYKEMNNDDLTRLIESQTRSLNLKASEYNGEEKKKKIL